MIAWYYDVENDGGARGFRLYQIPGRDDHRPKEQNRQDAKVIRTHSLARRLADLEE